MPTITDWLMVAITAVYVVATIFICRANIKSAEATREQVAESKRQYEETQRLQMMPYLQFDCLGDSGGHSLELVLASGDLGGGVSTAKISIKNIGPGTARDITYKWISFTNTYDGGVFPIQAIQSGDMQSLCISFAGPVNEPPKLQASFELHFKDFLGNMYLQTITFTFIRKNSGHTLFENVLTAPPILINKETDNA